MASAGSDYPKPFLQGLELQDDIPNVVSRSVNIPCVGHCLNSSQLIPIHLFRLKLDKKLTKVPTLGHFERQSHDVRVEKINLDFTTKKPLILGSKLSLDQSG